MYDSFTAVFFITGINMSWALASIIVDTAYGALSPLSSLMYII